MGQNSKIEWTDASWTPIRARNLATGKLGWHCEHATTGCEFCYAESMNKRVGTGLPFKPGHRKDIEIFLDEKMLTQPLRWRQPRKVFVCSMTDLFADFVTDQMIDRVFATMALCPQHTFQVLTKRAARMRDYIIGCHHDRYFHGGQRWGQAAVDVAASPCAAGVIEDIAFPIPNVWLGVSCERQEEADDRIPLLLQTPSAVRFVSAEPLLGPIDITRINTPGNGLGWFDAFASPDHCLDLVIVGGESGRNARPFEIEWARSIIAQCRNAGVSCFMKQVGSKPELRGFKGMPIRDSKGGDMRDWPDDLRVREMPA